MIIDYSWERLPLIKEILKSKRPFGKRTYNKILKLWSGRKIKSLEISKKASDLSSEELTLLNYLFGSDSICYNISDKKTQDELLKIIPNDLFRNFRRSTGNRNISISVEDWLWEENNTDFLNRMDAEMVCLENAILSYMVFMLGGFTAPRDNLKSKLNKWINIDVSVLFNQPRELFLLSNISPAILMRFLYWKSTSVLSGLMRLFSISVTEERLSIVNNSLKEQKYIK